MVDVKEPSSKPTPSISEAASTLSSEPEEMPGGHVGGGGWSPGTSTGIGGGPPNSGGNGLTGSPVAASVEDAAPSLADPFEEALLVETSTLTG